MQTTCRFTRQHESSHHQYPSSQLSSRSTPEQVATPSEGGKRKTHVMKKFPTNASRSHKTISRQFIDNFVLEKAISKIVNKSKNKLPRGNWKEKMHCKYPSLAQHWKALARRQETRMRYFVAVEKNIVVNTLRYWATKKPRPAPSSNAVCAQMLMENKC